MRISRLIVACLLFVIIPASFGWVHVPSGTVNASTFVCSDDESRIVMGVSGGGYWITQDGGQTWEMLNPWSPAPVNLYDSMVAVDSACDTVYVGAECTMDPDKILSYTFNGGADWEVMQDQSGLPIFPNIERIVVVDWSNHSRIWCFRSNYMIQSENAGIDWSYNVVDSINYGIGSFFQDQDDPSVIWAAGYYSFLPMHVDEPTNRFIRKSEDYGQTWSSPLNLDNLVDDTQPSGGSARCMIKLSNGDLLAGGFHYLDGETNTQEQLFRSTDGGLTGEWFNGNLPDGFFPEQLIEDPQQPGTVFLSGGLIYGLYRSTDYGATFNRVANGLPTGPLTVVNISKNEHNGTVYLSLHGWGVYATSDGGETWRELPKPPIGSRATINVFSDCIQLRHSGYIYKRYGFATESWDQLSFPSFDPYLPLVFPITFSDDQTIVVGTRLFNSENSDELRIATLRSDDQGETWQEIGERFTRQTAHYSAWQGETESRLVTVTATDVADLSQVCVSTDTGRTWTYGAEIQSAPGRLPGIHQSENYIYAVVQVSPQEGSIYRSADGGMTFENMDFPDSPNLLTVLTGDRLAVNAYIDNDLKKVYYYDGDSWELSNPSVSMNSEIVQASDDPERWVATHINGWGESSLLISENHGQTWVSRDLEIPYAEFKPFLGTLSSDPWRERIWVSTGIGLCYLPTSDLAVDDGPLNLLPLAHTVLSNFPNPFNQTTSITYTLRQAGRMELTLYDMQGRLIRTIDTGFREAGFYTHSLTMNDLASGTYFLRLVANGDVVNRKITLLK
ncbi:T9SS type A sorting domain-containing protein [bacterium]|nr:T9SS type A sorting domain-containing protein [bacterium]